MFIRYHFNWLALPFLYYQSNYPAVQLRRLEVSGVSCYDLLVFIKHLHDDRLHDDLKIFMIKVFVMQLQSLKTHFQV